MFPQLSSARLLVETAKFSPPLSLIPHPQGKRRHRTNKARKKKTDPGSQNEITLTAAEQAVLPLIQQLEMENLWSGKITSDNGRRLLRMFIRVPKQENEKFKHGDNRFIKLNAGAIDWWIRQGPLITTIGKGIGNRKFAGKAQQFKYFLDAVLRDRKDSKYAEEYECAAALLGLNAYHGELVRRIVAQACTLQGQAYPETSINQGGGEAITPISKASLMEAAEQIFSTVSATKSTLRSSTSTGEVVVNDGADNESDTTTLGNEKIDKWQPGKRKHLLSTEEVSEEHKGGKGRAESESEDDEPPFKRFKRSK